MLKIVIDSAGEIPEEWRKEFDIHVIPVNIHIENRTYLHGVELSDEEFYRIVETTGIIPKTSQPSPQQFIDFYKRIADASDTILSLHVSSKLSGTYNSAVLAARELKNILNIVPYDSQAGSAAIGFMCKEIRQLENAGATLQVIINRLDTIRQNLNIVLTLDSLEYAWKSGRVKAMQAVVAALIKIKPVIALKEGTLDIKEKVRTRQRSLEKVVEIIQERVGDQLVNVAVVHSQSLDAARSMMQDVKNKFRINELILLDLSIGIVANLGPGTIGIVAYAVA
jgi:DegV family protein with EDD domain